MNKTILKHIVDCSLAFAISFFSIWASTGNLRNFEIAFIPSVLIALIKFRDYWNTQLNPKCPTPTIFI